MKLKLKKEVKHSIVYETEDDKAPVRSVYVSRTWLMLNSTAQKFPPQEIEMEVKA